MWSLFDLIYKSRLADDWVNDIEIVSHVYGSQNLFPIMHCTHICTVHKIYILLHTNTYVLLVFVYG